jgi:hypothetical protein
VPRGVDRRRIRAVRQPADRGNWASSAWARRSISAATAASCRPVSAGAAVLVTPVTPSSASRRPARTSWRCRSCSSVCRSAADRRRTLGRDGCRVQSSDRVGPGARPSSRSGCHGKNRAPNEHALRPSGLPRRAVRGAATRPRIARRLTMAADWPRIIHKYGFMGNR